MTERKPSGAERGLDLVERTISAFAPAPDGGPPMAMRTARTRLGWLVAAGLGLGFGAVVGLLGVLAWQALPSVPMFLLGLLVGAFVGVVLCLVAASQIAALRRKGRFAMFLVPLVIIAAPFLLLGTGWQVLRGKGRSK